MRKGKKWIRFFAMIAALVFMAALPQVSVPAEGSIPPEEAGDYYPWTVTWLNGDGSTLDQKVYNRYDEPTPSTDLTPTKADEEDFSYVFSTWNEVSETEDDNGLYTTYEPIFEKVPIVRHQLTIRYQYADGTQAGETYTAQVKEGAEYAVESPGITGYAADPATVSGTMGEADVEKTVTYTVLKYQVRFVNEDGTELQKGDVAYGTTPAYGGETPVKAATAQYTYTFAGWTPEIAAVAGNADYTATFNETVNQYTVRFLNDDGTELQKGSLPYGATPAYGGEMPAKAATAQYTYTFAKWIPEIAAVAGDADYTATFSATVNQYTVRFLNEDGTELQKGSLAYGATPAYGGEMPAKAATAQYTYTFAEWIPEIAAVAGDATYTATFSATVNKYTVSFMNDDGTVLQESSVEYGATPKYEGATPVKPATPQYTYEFTGWEPEIAAVAGDATYTATFSATVNKYTVSFMNDDGTVLQESSVEYGATPKYEGATPVKPATGEYTYEFAGWEPEIAKVTGDATYKAVFTAKEKHVEMPGDTSQTDQSGPAGGVDPMKKYTVRFLNEDGTELQKGSLAYGATPAYGGETPVKAATAQYTYTFAGWTPEIAAVAGNADYTATFNETVNQYTVRFLNDDGTELQKGSLPYGATPAYGGEIPEKAATAQYTYTFAGWTPEVVKVTGNAIYNAEFKEELRKYTVQFLNEDGTVLQKSSEYYGTTPEYTEETPAKAATAEHTYTFAGWTPEIKAVDGNADYTATFKETPVETGVEAETYTIRFVNDDGTILQEQELAGGATPAYGGEMPVKAATAQYTYTFAGWDPEIRPVAGDEVYKATYTANGRSYMITFLNEDGVTQLESRFWPYGVTPSCSKTPTKEGEGLTVYTFAGWTPEIQEVKGEATYTATYDTREAERKTEGRHTFYVDNSTGTTSVTVGSEKNKINWLRAESGGTGAWYGFDNNGDGNAMSSLPEGSVVGLKWIAQDEDPEKFEKTVKEATGGQSLESLGLVGDGAKIWLFQLNAYQKTTDADGNVSWEKIGQNGFNDQMVVYIERGNDWDINDIEAFWLEGQQKMSGIKFEEKEINGEKKQFAKIKLDHFSTYLLVYKLKEE